MYVDKEFVSFKFADLRYMMNMLHFVKDQQRKYILVKMISWLMPFLLWVRRSLLGPLLLLLTSICTMNFLMNSKHY
jgi:hypothetical protein